MMSRSRELAASVGRLEERVAQLEGEIQESRAMNRRLADVVDVVTELLVPAMDRDDERVRAAIERFERLVPPADPDGGAEADA
jgi:hypothetical protein